MNTDRPTTEDFFRGDAASSAGAAEQDPSSRTTGVHSPGGFDSTGSVRAGSRSAGQLMKEITEDLSLLFRKEIELAKQEVGGALSAKAKGAVIGAVAGFFGLLALMFVLLALRDGLDTFLWTWVADLVTALILLLVGAVAVVVARRKLQTPINAELTKQTVKEDLEWAKSIGKR